MRYQFYTADVFTDSIFGGNPLAVIPDARGLETDQMQLVAREFNLSETVFVFPPEVPGHARRLRIFTPAAELPFAGHPTIGTAHILASIGEIALAGEVTRIILEEGIGPVEVSIHVDQNQPVFVEFLAARLPEYGPTPPPAETIASLLSLEASDLVTEDGLQAVSCGVPFLFLPMRNRDAVRRARIQREQWENLLSSFWAPHIYVFTREVQREGSDLHARMFAPALGIAEDPATGAAATALAGYLGMRDPVQDGPLRWTIEQGFEMGRPSILKVNAEKKKGEIVAIRVGGATVRVSEGIMEIPEIGEQGPVYNHRLTFNCSRPTQISKRR